VTRKKFIEAGYPVVKDMARFRSKDTANLGNGDAKSSKYKEKSR